ncbi:MAG: radical SAM family heme chaperone HemW [Magnetococcus sp. YQC-3]
MTGLPPLTLYLHTPFCRRKCPYCDFRSSAVNTAPEQRYLAAVKQELQMRRRQLSGDTRPLQAIFLGGGTPSLLASATIAGYLEAIVALWPLVPDCEITLEANPESATLEKMRDWRQMGISRLSLGVQALAADRLRFLERPHDLERARSAIRHAQQVGFPALSLDLIYATPGQTPLAWETELTEAMAWAPEHLSCYQLTIEPGTPFFARNRSGDWPAMGEEMEARLFQQTRSQLAAGGWMAYETSNFAQPGFACRHNRNYWSFGDYLGIGAAAHGKRTDPEGKIWRSRNPDAAEAYMARMEQGASLASMLEEQLVTAAEAGREALLMGLRHDAGVNLPLYRQLSGEDLLQRHALRIAHWQEAGFVRLEQEQLRLTEQGAPLLDAILLELI